MSGGRYQVSAATFYERAIVGLVLPPRLLPFFAEMKRKLLLGGLISGPLAQLAARCSDFCVTQLSPGPAYNSPSCEIASTTSWVVREPMSTRKSAGS